MSFPPNGGYGNPYNEGNFRTPQDASTPHMPRNQRPRFAYSGPPNYPRPGSSAAKPNPSSFSSLMRSRYNPGDQMTDSMANNFGDSMQYADPSCQFDNPSFQGSFSSEYSTNDSLNSTQYYSCNESFGASPQNNRFRTQQQSTPMMNMRNQFKANSSVRGSGRFKKKPYARPKQLPGQKSEWRCDLCDLDFTSKVPFAMHFQGSKHAKKLKTKDAMQNIQSANGKHVSKIGIAFRCDLCGIITNSTFQLQTHLAGNKHKARVKEQEESEGKSKGETEEKTETASKKESATKEPQNKETKSNGQKKKAPKDKPADVPPDVEMGESSAPPPKKEKPPAPPKQTFPCTICSVILNSEMQYHQHLSGKNHKAKVEGKPIPSKKNNPPKPGILKNKTQPSSTIVTAEATAANSQDQAQTVVGIKTLAASFVTGGTIE